MSEYAVAWDGQVITLPAGPANSEIIYITQSWHDEAGLDPARATRGRTTVEVRLVPRPDNPYQAYAVAINCPPFGELTLDESQLGFLRDFYLERLGFETLHNLARYSRDGEIRATAVLNVRDGSIQAICLPSAKQLRTACDEFFRARTTPPLESRKTLKDLLDLEAYGIKLTRDDLARLRTYDQAALPVDGVSLHSLSSGERGVARTFVVRDMTSNRFLGTFEDDYLLLDDERNREAALAHLHGVPFRQPTSEFPIPNSLRWTDPTPPNAFIRPRKGGFDIRARNPASRSSEQSFAHWNPGTQTLFVEDKALAGAAVAYAARVGLQVRDLKIAKSPWRLTQEYRFNELRHLPDWAMQPPEPLRAGYDYSFDTNPAAAPTLPQSVLRRLPSDLVHEREINPARRVETGEREPFFDLHEKLLHERDAFFPLKRMTGAVVPCRLCGDPSSEFTTPGCSGPLSYCHVCFQHFRGNPRISTQKRAAIAVKFLSEHEFSGEQILEWQLDEVRLEETEPRTPAEVDLLLAARMAVRRNAHPWTKVLHQAGLLKDGYRTSRGVIMVAADNHLCLSMLEKAVDDFMFKNGIEHEREPHYPFDAELNPRTARRADFRLTDGTLVEVWGFPDDPAYAAKMVEKEALAARHRLRLVGISAGDLPRLPTLLGPWIRPGVKIEPVELPAARSPKEAKVADPNSDPRGGFNAVSKARRDERLERCQEAVKLQADGRSRAEIGKLLNLGPDSVKALLRDGKFYGDPDTDPTRNELASRAAEARRRGLRKAEFKIAAGLTMPKATEAWRDAGVIFGVADLPGGED